MPNLQIITVPNPLLKEKSEDVKEFDQILKNTIRNMYDTLYSSGNGIGLAAPQVGIMKRIVVIDKGKKHGIYIGQNVIGTKGLVGQIVETSFLSSKVILITEPSHDIPGQVNRTGEKIIVSGSKEDGKLIVNYASTNSDIQKGDVISTSGAGNRFKPKIPIGEVKNVSSELDIEFKRVEIEPFEDPERMPELILIWDYKPKENIDE